ncbi:MAG TPA: transcription elongation factor GreB [Verrucomicrobiales bacterium]|nr:transcription elongation factor GreB [Verrucomicrobiales bacterium]
MSKAFTRESDDESEFPAARPSSSLPPGTPNYLTPDGAERIRAELARLVEVERPARLGSPGNAGDRSRVAALDQRILQLQETLQTAVVPSPPDPGDTRLRFGQWGHVRRGGGETVWYRIVGVDEMDVDRGWVSWLSPIARALVNRTPGDRVQFRFPSGQEELELLEVRTQAPACEGGGL